MSEAAPGPSISRGIFLGTYEVADVIQREHDGEVQSFCKDVPEGLLASQHCGKQIWAVYGPKQLALLEAPNMALKDYSRIDAFAMMGEPFCFSNCRWEESYTYGQIRRTLFTTSAMVRGFEIPAGAEIGLPEVAEELQDHEVFFFHLGIDASPLQSLEQATNAQLGRTAQEAVTAFLGNPVHTPSASSWRILMPKGFNKGAAVKPPRQIVLRETYRFFLLNARIEIVREYILVRKSS